MNSCLLFIFYDFSWNKSAAYLYNVRYRSSGTDYKVKQIWK
jgi:hypothetical protein